MGSLRIPFNRATYTGNELDNIRSAIEGGHLTADGPFTARCREWLESKTGCEAALLVHSCTAALEMAALLADVKPGDEVIMPSYTFVTTATAFTLRGGVPVFVDIREDTMNMDESQIEEAITARTRCLVPVHYAGVGCEMDEIQSIAEQHGLFVIEDAAQALLASHDGRPVGTFAPLGAISFHETKNVTSGEGGALLVNDERLVDRAEVLRLKGTDRSRFERGQADKYTWRDHGSSFAMSDLAAAFLFAQLQEAEVLTARRLAVWDRYQTAFEPLERKGDLRRPVIPPRDTHNGHMYGLVLGSRDERDALIDHLRDRGIGAVFHYIPLHSSPAGSRWGRPASQLPVTEMVAACLVRLPVWADLGEDQVEVINAVYDFFGVSGLSRAPSASSARPL
jgi:dTDP-4-amino-4,6-dideoxygalactose transaminase